VNLWLVAGRFLKAKNLPRISNLFLGDAFLDYAENFDEEKHDSGVDELPTKSPPAIRCDGNH
jgi:hypothetical protein